MLEYDELFDEEELHGVQEDEVNNAEQMPIVYINEELDLDEEGIDKYLSPLPVRDVCYNILDIITEGNDIFHMDGILVKYNKASKHFDHYAQPKYLKGMINDNLLCVEFKEIKRNKQIIFAETVTPAKDDFANFILTSMDSYINKNIPEVKGIMYHPYFDENHNIVSEPGYNSDTKFYLPEECTFDIKEMDVEEAIEIFDNTLGKMHHKEDKDYLFDLLRFIAMPWRGVCKMPIFAVNGNVPTCGKGFSNQIMNEIWYGNEEVAINIPKDSEMEDKIFGYVLKSEPMVLFDNIEYPVKSPVLSSIVTRNTVSKRLLYTDDVQTIEKFTAISINGNNLDMNNDIASRCIMINYYVEERPDDRGYDEGDAETDIMDYISKNKCDIISASIALSKRYIEDETPDYNDFIGFNRFTKFKQLPMSILAHLQHIEDLKDNSKFNTDMSIKKSIGKDRADSNQEWSAYRAAVRATIDIIGLDKTGLATNPFIAGDLFEIWSESEGHYKSVKGKGDKWGAKGLNIMEDYIVGNGDHGRRSVLGRYIKKYTDVPVVGWKLEYMGMMKHPSNRSDKPHYRYVVINEKLDYYKPDPENLAFIPGRKPIDDESEDRETKDDEYKDPIPF